MRMPTCLLVPCLCLVAPAARAADPPPPAATAEQARVAEQQRMLSSLWIFASLNYLYCDVVGLMDAKMLRQYQEGKVAGTRISENFLLGATLFMQVPLSMVVLSTALGPRASRIANISAGALMTVAQTASLFVTRPRSYYALSSAVEIGTTGFITAYSLWFMKPPPVAPVLDAERGMVGLQGSLTF